MTTREKAHALLDELPDTELDDVMKLLENRRHEGEARFVEPSLA